MRRSYWLAFVALAALSVALCAQPADSNLDAPYVIGPDDSLSIHVADMEDFSAAPFIVDLRGNVTLPRVGRVHVAGLSADQLEAIIAQKLKEYLQNPDVLVTVTQFHTQPVSVLGEVVTPGVQQIRGSKSLFDVIVAAGGLKIEAGKSIKITRRVEMGPIPLPNAVADKSGEFYVAEVPVPDVSNATSAAANLEIKGRDVISIPKGEMVYILGAVKRPGGYVLGGNGNLTVLKAMAMSDGLDKTASAKHARILRPTGTASRTQIPIDIQKIMSSKSDDVALQPEDILFVPTSATRNVAIRTVESAISIGTNLALYSARF